MKSSNSMGDAETEEPSVPENKATLKIERSAREVIESKLLIGALGESAGPRCKNFQADLMRLWDEAFGTP